MHLDPRVLQGRPVMCMFSQVSRDIGFARVDVAQAVHHAPAGQANDRGAETVGKTRPCWRNSVHDFTFFMAGSYMGLNDSSAG